MHLNKKTNALENLVSHFIATLPESSEQRVEMLQTFLDRVRFNTEEEKEIGAKLHRILFHLFRHKTLIKKLQSELPLKIS